MINCVILDDELPSVELLTHFCMKSGVIKILLATTDAIEAHNFIKNNTIHLLFCDIQMPEISGIDFVKNLINKHQLQVVFTTAFSEYAIQGFDLEATDYLLKPFTFARFLAALQKVENKLTSAEGTDIDEMSDFLFIKGGVKGKYDKVNMDDIEYVESDGNYVSLYHNGKMSLSNQSLKDLEKILPKSKFMRVHKSFIISKKRIAKVQGYTLRLFNHDKDISIGDSYREGFFNFIKNKTI
ncbi:LytTR family DNA-binding domain-containing protein [Pedobacter gandavensis]|uniref:LytR/AlgR family response regulator transcription factor n=1 Tax=Pedobacter gandavensis TaxID=2679963 RepID=UPI00293023DC|nr:LytTR family DNA-binding domain-containing protein [Pedobacter gandavensis]